MPLLEPNQAPGAELMDAAWMGLCAICGAAAMLVMVCVLVANIVVVLGGEPCLGPLAEKIDFARKSIYNLYGFP